jgi:hypothetical protein
MNVNYVIGMSSPLQFSLRGNNKENVSFMLVSLDRAMFAFCSTRRMVVPRSLISFIMAKLSFSRKGQVPWKAHPSGAIGVRPSMLALLPAFVV